MFGKTAFILKIILLWCFLTIILAKSVRLKKDVHHMIYINEKRRPTKSNRYISQQHDQYTEERPQKTKKKYAGQKYRDFDNVEESYEENTHDKHVRHSPKSKRHPQKHTHLPGHNQKRQNDKRHHKKHQKENHHHHQSHGNHVNRDPVKLPTTNWLPMSSKELFRTEPNNVFKNSLQNHQTQGYSQPIPMEITTHFPINTFSFQSTVYPPLSPTYSQYLNQNSASNSPSPPLIEPLGSYKPFDYSVLEQTNPNSSYQEQEPASSNVVNVKQSSEKDVSSLSVVVENSRESLGSREKKEEKKIKKNEGSGIKSEKSKINAKRPRGGARYRIRTTH